MGITLEAFIEEAQKNLKNFEADYRKKHEQNPEHYPLELPVDNAGLWYEFFMDYPGSDTEES